MPFIVQRASETPSTRAPDVAWKPLPTNKEPRWILRSDQLEHTVAFAQHHLDLPISRTE
jgi:hypothetical protein